MVWRFKRTMLCVLFLGLIKCTLAAKKHTTLHCMYIQNIIYACALFKHATQPGASQWDWSMCIENFYHWSCFCYVRHVSRLKTMFLEFAWFRTNDHDHVHDNVVRYKVLKPLRFSKIKTKSKAIWRRSIFKRSCSEQLLMHTFSCELSPSRRREAPCEGTNSPRLFTPGKRKH
jgi:hypothetical protein